MYKVFINKKLVIFISSAQFDTQLINNKNVLVVSDGKFSTKNKKIVLSNSSQNLFVVCKNVKKAWTAFKKQLKIIYAGGGLVLNNDHEMLFIFRKKKWDLPKGKLDKGETISACAKREVMEECGIKHLQLKSKITDTFHIYTLKNKPVLKITTWYFMHMNKKQNLTPQLEEEIEKVKFFSKKNYLRTVKKNTYPLISNLIESIPSTIY